MPNYLVKIVIIMHDNDAKIVQCYLVNSAQAKLLLKIDYDEEGGCCSQTGCMMCYGADIKYHSKIRVHRDQMELARFAIIDDILKLNKLLDRAAEVDDDSD